MPNKVTKQFSLIKLGLDNRPKNYSGFGLLLIPKDSKILLFGGDQNPVKYTFLFDLYSKQVSKCNIYTETEDKFMTNWVWTNESFAMAFGVNWLHIFDYQSNKFMSAICYDTSVS